MKLKKLELPKSVFWINGSVRNTDRGLIFKSNYPKRSFLGGLGFKTSFIFSKFDNDISIYLFYEAF